MTNTNPFKVGDKVRLTTNTVHEAFDPTADYTVDKVLEDYVRFDDDQNTLYHHTLFDAVPQPKFYLCMNPYHDRDGDYHLEPGKLYTPDDIEGLDVTDPDLKIVAPVFDWEDAKKRLGHIHQFNIERALKTWTNVYGSPFNISPPVSAPSFSGTPSYIGGFEDRT